MVKMFSGFSKFHCSSKNVWYTVAKGVDFGRRSGFNILVIFLFRILMEWVLKKIFLLLAEKLLAELTFTEGCVNSTELLFTCCSLRNLGGVKLGKDSGM